MDSVVCLFALFFFFLVSSPECMMCLRHHLCWGVMDSDLHVLLFWKALLEAQAFATTTS